MSDLDIIIGRPSFGLPDLVLHGDRQPGWCLMHNWQLPFGMESRNVTVESTWLDGSPVVSSTYADAIAQGDVLPEAEDTADLAALISELTVAISPLSYPLQVIWKGYEFPVRTGRRGSLAMSPIDWREVRDDQPVFSLTIPCSPITGA